MGKYKHGGAGTRLYGIWKNMRERCYKPYCKEYKWYGAKGISVCDEWNNSFVTFYNWAINNGYKEDLTIDRINNDECYSPENCRWVNIQTQARNRRNSLYVEYKGKKTPLKELCENMNIKYPTAYCRIKILGWSVEDALTKPVRKGK